MSIKRRPLESGSVNTLFLKFLTNKNGIRDNREVKQAMCLLTWEGLPETIPDHVYVCGLDSSYKVQGTSEETWYN